MSEYEIEDAIRRHAPDSIAGRAARFLSEFRHEVNANSDGWPYWSPPVKAAAKLMGLIQNPALVIEQDLKAALRPIKSFYTRRGYKAGMKWPALFDDAARDEVLEAMRKTQAPGRAQI